MAAGESFFQQIPIDRRGTHHMDILPLLDQGIHDRMEKSIDPIRHIQKIPTGKQYAHGDLLSPYQTGKRESIGLIRPLSLLPRSMALTFPDRMRRKLSGACRFS